MCDTSHKKHVQNTKFSQGMYGTLTPSDRKHVRLLEDIGFKPKAIGHVLAGKKQRVAGMIRGGWVRTKKGAWRRPSKKSGKIVYKKVSK